MTRESVLARITERFVVPVVVIDDANRARPLAEALAAADLPCAEITLRTPESLNALEKAASLEHFIVGAGTVLTADQARQAIDAGAQFLVSPGLSRDVAEIAAAAGIPLLPGTVTATEVMAALDLAINVVKFFPAATSGGPAAVKALSAPFPSVGFIPTGGVNPGNLPDYLAVPAVVAVGGTWITTPQLLAMADFKAITQLAAAAVATAAEHRPATTTARTGT